MYKIGIIGLPPKKLLGNYLSSISKEEVIDLDMPVKGVNYYDVIENIFPKIYCAILRTAIVNALTLKPAIILVDIGSGKCEGTKYLTEILKKVLPDTKIEAMENYDKISFGTSISTSNLPLRRKMELIVEGVISNKQLEAERCEPTVGFWGTPPRDFSILDLFPNTTHIFGWSRCLENKTPDNIKLEMEVSLDIPTIFFAQSFCQKSALAKYLAHKYHGLYVEVDTSLDYSTISKILAFLTLKDII